MLKATDLFSDHTAAPHSSAIPVPTHTDTHWHTLLVQLSRVRAWTFSSLLHTATSSPPWHAHWCRPLATQTHALSFVGRVKRFDLPTWVLGSFRCAHVDGSWTRFAENSQHTWCNAYVVVTHTDLKVVPTDWMDYLPFQSFIKLSHACVVWRDHVMQWHLKLFCFRNDMMKCRCVGVSGGWWWWWGNCSCSLKRMTKNNQSKRENRPEAPSESHLICRDI